MFDSHFVTFLPKNLTKNLIISVTRVKTNYNYKDRIITSLLKHMPLVSAWSTCHKCANFRFLHWEHAKGMAIFQLGMLTCYRHANFSTLSANFSTSPAKRHANFSTVFQKKNFFFNFWIFQLCLTFANFKNIWAILENLNKEFKFWHLQNFIKEMKN